MSLIDIANIFIWWFVFLLIGITFLPFTVKLFSPFKDKGYIFSKFLGLILISYTLYVFSSLHLLKFNLISIVLVWILFLFLSFWIHRKEKLDYKKYLKFFIVEEVIFLVTLIIWAYIRGFNPDIHNLEKFMDFGFINSILRTDYFPARDMWFTPLSINYYYFGHLYTAVMTKLAFIPSFVSFNLMIATIFAFIFTLSFSIGINLTSQIKDFSFKKLVIIGIIFGYIVSLSGSLHTIFAFFKPYSVDSPTPFWNLALSITTFPNSYWYPNATRFIYNTIHEFPSYSFVVSDLHGHVLSIPIVMTIIAVLLLVFLDKKISYLKTIILGFLISLAFMTNAFDALIYLPLTLLVLFFVKLIFQENKIKKRIANSLILLFKHGLLILVSFFLFSFIFNQSFAPFSTGIGLNCSPSFLTQIGNIGPFLFEEGKCQTTPPWQFLILYGFFIFMVTSFVFFLRKKVFIVTDYFVILISIFSLLLLIIPEFFYFKDIYDGHFRANTMFKLAYQSFIMLSISSIYIFIRIAAERFNYKSNISKLSVGIFLFIASGMILLVSIYPYLSVPAGYKGLKGNVGLDGIKYLESIKPQDYKAIVWINNNISGQPVMLEAQGDSYTDFNRISANTGLPTILGWTVHEWLWRGSYDIPSARFEDIKNIYESSDAEITKNLLNKFEVSYVYVGGLEREKYKVFEQKFLKIGSPVYSEGGTVIYRINY